VSFLNRHLAQVIAINGRQRKATYGQVQGDMNDWNHDASCTLTSLPVWDLENFKRLVFVEQSVQKSVKLKKNMVVTVGRIRQQSFSVTR
jgi:hypothetical protein